MCVCIYVCVYHTYTHKHTTKTDTHTNAHRHRHTHTCTHITLCESDIDVLVEFMSVSLSLTLTLSLSPPSLSDFCLVQGCPKKMIRKRSVARMHSLTAKKFFFIRDRNSPSIFASMKTISYLAMSALFPPSRPLSAPVDSP